MEFSQWQRVGVMGIVDVAEFLDISPSRVFDLAAMWPSLASVLWDRSTPETYYTAWTADFGRANLCANIIDQHSRANFFTLTGQLIKRNPGFRLLDLGCGCGLLAWPLLPNLASAALVDVPNVAQDFLRWRLARADYGHVRSFLVDDPAWRQQTYDVVLCVDVLEHLTNPSDVFAGLTELTVPGGVLLFRAPWGPDAEIPEHLPEAPIDWNRPGGGADQLKTDWRMLREFDFGGLYMRL